MRCATKSTSFRLCPDTYLLHARPSGKTECAAAAMAANAGPAVTVTARAPAAAPPRAAPDHLRGQRGAQPPLENRPCAAGPARAAARCLAAQAHLEGAACQIRGRVPSALLARAAPLGPCTQRTRPAGRNPRFVTALAAVPHCLALRACPQPQPSAPARRQRCCTSYAATTGSACLALPLPTRGPMPSKTGPRIR